MNDEIIEENDIEQMVKAITLGGTEFRYNIKKHKPNKEENELSY